MANIVLVTKGTYGDLVPFLAIGSYLKKRGHDVTLATHCEYEGAARKAALKFDSWDSPEQYREFIADGPLLDTPAGLATFAERHMFPSFGLERAVIHRNCRKPNSVLIVRHMASLAASMLSEEFRIPLVSVFTAVAQANLIPVLAVVARQSLAVRINGLRENLGLAKISDWLGWLSSCDLALGCWPTAFATPLQCWPNRLIPLGFLRFDEIESDELEPELLGILANASAAPILVTGGTSRWTLGPKFYQVAPLACALVGRIGIVACPHDEFVPVGKRPAGIHFYQRLPFASLMKHVAAVIHHGGTSIMVRAIAAGVPQLMLPHGGDRPDTALRTERLGTGIRLLPEQWEPEYVASQLRRLLDGLLFREATMSAQSLLHDAYGLTSGCEAIESLANSDQVAANRL